MRHLLPVLAITLLLNGLPQVADADSTPTPAEARAVLDKAIKAHGGEARIARQKAMHIKMRARINIPDIGDFFYTLENTWNLPKQYKSVMNFVFDNQTVTRTVVVNGDDHWIMIKDDIRPLSERELEEVKQQMHAETVNKLIALRDSSNELRPLSETRIDGRPVTGFTVVREGKRDVHLYFDKATGLLVKMEHLVKDHTGKDYSQEVVFLDYRETQGVKHWGRVVVLNDHNPICEFEVAEVRFLDRVDERIFARPPSKQPPKKP